MEHRWAVGQVLFLPPYPQLEVIELVEDGYVVKLAGEHDKFVNGQPNRTHASAFHDPWLANAKPSVGKKVSTARPPETPDEVLAMAAGKAR